MRRFAKLNLFSFLHAMVLCAELELMINAVRLERVLGWGESRVELLVLILAAGSTAALFCAIRSCWRNEKADRVRYFAAVLWLSGCLLPPLSPQEEPLGGVGIAFLGLAMVYPLYILLLHAACLPWMEGAERQAG